MLMLYLDVLDLDYITSDIIDQMDSKKQESLKSALQKSWNWSTVSRTQLKNMLAHFFNPKSCSRMVITSALHAEGRQFKPDWKHICFDG